MPNHFHLLIKQKARGAMEGLMRSITTRYSMYFNKKYNRIGPLFQGTYKAIVVTRDEYLLYLSRYIHLNPAESTNNLTDAYSSYADYLGLKNSAWVKTDLVLSSFNQEILSELEKINNYQDFVEKYKKDAAKLLGGLILE
jgi:putative transposase